MKSIARRLRKLADLIDPTVKPSIDRSTITATVDLDKTAFDAGMQDIQEKCERLRRYAERIAEVHF